MYIHIVLYCTVLYIPFAVFKTSRSPLALSNGITSVSDNIWSVISRRGESVTVEDKN